MFIMKMRITVIISTHEIEIAASSSSISSSLYYLEVNNDMIPRKETMLSFDFVTVY